MNHQFLIHPAMLNQTVKSNGSSEGGAANSGITRRTFITGTGGAAVGTVVAWSALGQESKAVVGAGTWDINYTKDTCNNIELT